MAAPIAQAAPVWQPALTISSPFAAPVGIEPILTMGASGDIAAAWWEGGDIVAAVRPAGASTFSQQTVSTPGDKAAYPSVAVSASGAVVVAWMDETAGQYEVAVRPSGGSFSAPVQAGSTGGSPVHEISVAIDDAGDVLLGEIEDTGGNALIAYAWQPAGGTFTITPVTVPASNISSPVVAMDGAGDAVMAWNDNVGTTHTIVRAITRLAGGAFGPTQTLTSGSEYAFAVSVAIGSGGQAAVLWQSGMTTPPYRIEASTSAGPSDLLTVPQTISAPATSDEYPAVGVGGNGETVAAWEQSGVTASEAAASAVAGGSFGAPAELGEAGTGYPLVAMDGAGDALIAWGANPFGGSETVEAVMRAADGALGPETVLSEPGEKIDWGISANLPAVSTGMDSAGDAVVSWERNSDHTLQARLYQAASSQTTTPPPGQPILIPCPGSVAFRTSTSTCPLIAVCAAALARPAGSDSTHEPACVPRCEATRFCGPRCVVPRLEGLSKTAAKRRLLATDCELGKVRVAKRYKHARRLVVTAQSLKAGKQFRAGTSVSLTLKPSPPRHKHRR